MERKPASIGPLGELARILPPSAEVRDGRLWIGGCDTVELASDLGTPLYVFDEVALDEECRAFAAAMASGPPGSRGLYALKAFPVVAMARLAYEAGLGILCASGGEVAVARAAGVPAEALVLHGNNKSDDELRSAVGRIVVDSFHEISRLEQLGVEADVWLRVAPGLEAGSHAFVRTGGLDSKFGVGIGQAREAAERLAALPHVRLRGLHAHVGSQWFGDEGRTLRSVMVPLLRELSDAVGIELRELDLGGGLAIAYTRHDPDVPTPAEAARAALAAWPDDLALILEPGRALVGRAGVTLHTVGAVKEIPGVRTYVSVDGGMSDNVRPPLYGARYEFVVANRAEEPHSREVRLVGKHCESGDVLADEAGVPAGVRAGDVLVTAATGAYCLAMSSNYNQLARPAVVFCRDGGARVVLRRETAEDLLRLHAR